jgi:hypothetical protein
MSDLEWWTEENPERLLNRFLAPTAGPESDWHATPRKLRLVNCACVRQVWHMLADPRSRRAVEAAERFADATERALDALLGYA